jgi:hypothetical protein
MKKKDRKIREEKEEKTLLSKMKMEDSLIITKTV